MSRYGITSAVLAVGLLFFCLGMSAPTQYSDHLLSEKHGSWKNPARGWMLFPVPMLQAFLHLEEEYRPDPTKTQRTNQASETEDLPAEGLSIEHEWENPVGTRNIVMILTGVFLLWFVYKLRSPRLSPPLQKDLHDPPQEDSGLAWSLPEPQTLERQNETESYEKTPITLDSALDEEDHRGVEENRNLYTEISVKEIRREARQEGRVDVGRLLCLLESTRSSYQLSRGLYLLGKYRVKEALPVILKDMAHPDKWVRAAAAIALINMKSKIIEERMIEMAEHRNLLVRSTALLVLSRIGTPPTYEVLRNSIWDFEPEVRENAVLAIGRLKVSNADFELQEAMVDFEDRVRALATWAYQRIQGSL